MHDKYCLPIIKHHSKEVFEDIEHNAKHYHFFEVWLDYIENVDEEFITKLAEKYPHRIIFLFRRENSEQIEMSSDNRFQIIRALHNARAFADLDIKSQLAEFEYIKLNDLHVHVIGSYHNYKKTPDLTELHLISEEIATHHPEIIKIATYCNDEMDAVRLLQLQLELKGRHQKHIVLGLGEHGEINRVFGSLWGNELIFAPESERHHTSAGQLTRSQLDDIFKILQ